MNEDQVKLLDDLHMASTNIATWLKSQVDNGSINGLIDIRRINELAVALSAFDEGFDLSK